MATKYKFLSLKDFKGTIAFSNNHLAQGHCPRSTSFFSIVLVRQGLRIWQIGSVFQWRQCRQVMSGSNLRPGVCQEDIITGGGSNKDQLG